MYRSIVVNLKELLKEKGMTIRELSRRTGIRPSSLYELVNDKRLNAHYPHLARIADALDIDDINRIITLKKIEDETNSNIS